jgi:methylated-DNA-[protein]-cysteine S-methyltransferase
MAELIATIATPCCTVGVRATGTEITEIAFLPPAHAPVPAAGELGRRAARQLRAYLEDARSPFDLPLAARGTDFQRRVWRCIAAIPCGETATYGDIARELRSAPRAVGQACGSNPFPLVVPCHRVVSAAGLGGFAHARGGFLLRTKRWLLEHEGR